MCAAPHNRTRTLEGLEERFGGENTRERARERESEKARERESERARERMRKRDRELRRRTGQGMRASQTSSSRDKVQMGSVRVNVVRAKARDEKALPTDEDAEGRGRRERRPERIFSLLLFPSMLHAGRECLHPTRGLFFYHKI
jgi:hypothetical protein